MAKATTAAQWDTRLLVHARAKEVIPVARLSGKDRLGAVFVTKEPRVARHAVQTMRTHSETAPVMFDANLYSGKSRKLAQAGLDTHWPHRPHPRQRRQRQ